MSSPCQRSQSTITFREVPGGLEYWNSVICALSAAGCTAEGIKAFEKTVSEQLDPLPSDATVEDPLFNRQKNQLDFHLNFELQKLENSKLKKNERLRSGEGFVCLKDLAFTVVCHLPRDPVSITHHNQSLWDRLPVSTAAVVAPVLSSKEQRRVEAKIYYQHRDNGFHADVFGRPKANCLTLSFLHLCPLAPICRAAWIPGVILGAGRKDGRLLTNREAEMLVFGTEGHSSSNRTSLITDAENFLLMQNDARFDRNLALLPILPWERQLSWTGGPVSVLVLASDSFALRDFGASYGKFEILDPSVADHRRQISLALFGLMGACSDLIRTYRDQPCHDLTPEKKHCAKVRSGLLGAHQFYGPTFDVDSLGGRVFMKINFSKSLVRGEPYPATSPDHPCPNLVLLAHRSVNCVINHLYKMGLLPGLPYDPSMPTAVLSPCCLDVSEGLKSCTVCRRYVQENLYGEAYYTSDEDDDSSGSSSVGFGDVSADSGCSDLDKLAQSGSSLASRRETEAGSPPDPALASCLLGLSGC